MSRLPPLCATAHSCFFACGPRAPLFCPVLPQALCINVGEILNDYGIYAMFHDLLREAGESFRLFPAGEASICHDDRAISPLGLKHSFTTGTESVRVIPRKNASGHSAFGRAELYRGPVASEKELHLVSSMSCTA